MSDDDKQATHALARSEGPQNDAEGRERVESRVEFIVELMRDLRWQRGRSGKELAKLWGVSEQRVRELASEASRRVKLEYADVLDHEAVRSKIAMALDRVVSFHGDAKAVVAAAKVWADVIGASAPQKVEQKIDARMSAMTDEELEAQILAAAAEIEAKKAGGG